MTEEAQAHMFNKVTYGVPAYHAYQKQHLRKLQVSTGNESPGQ